jgi:hypothetical protein
MIDRIGHLPLRRRITLAICLIVGVVLVALAGFALRGAI